MHPHDETWNFHDDGVSLPLLLLIYLSQIT
jgi:hypothetical protein